MKALAKTNYQDFTKLPLKEFVKADNTKNEIAVVTPHKGTITIPAVEGWLFKTEKDASTVRREILDLEVEAHDYLFDQWLSTLDKE